MIDTILRMFLLSAAWMMAFAGGYLACAIDESPMKWKTNEYETIFRFCVIASAAILILMGVKQ